MTAWTLVVVSCFTVAQAYQFQTEAAGTLGQRVVPLVYSELHRQARCHMHRERRQTFSSPSMAAQVGYAVALPVSPSAPFAPVGVATVVRLGASSGLSSRPSGRSERSGMYRRVRTRSSRRSCSTEGIFAGHGAVRKSDKFARRHPTGHAASSSR